MKNQLVLLPLLSLSLAAGPAFATKVKEAQPGLLKQAALSPSQALRIAHKRFPKGVIQEAEVEQEGGKLIYSFDIKLKGHSGIQELNLDAKDGNVVSIHHESPAAEAREK